MVWQPFPGAGGYLSGLILIIHNRDVVIGTFNLTALILLPLRPASVMHKNPQRHKIIHGMRPVGCKVCMVEYPFGVISVAADL